MGRRGTKGVMFNFWTGILVNSKGNKRERWENCWKELGSCLKEGKGMCKEMEERKEVKTFRQEKEGQ